MSFVLVLFLIYGSNAAAMTAVPGFKSMESCREAADMWTKSVPSGKAVCVPVK